MLREHIRPTDSDQPFPSSVQGNTQELQCLLTCSLFHGIQLSAGTNMSYFTITGYDRQKRNVYLLIQYITYVVDERKLKICLRGKRLVTKNKYLTVC